MAALSFPSDSNKCTNYDLFFWDETHILCLLAWLVFFALILVYMKKKTCNLVFNSLWQFSFKGSIKKIPFTKGTT